MSIDRRPHSIETNGITGSDLYRLRLVGAQMRDVMQGIEGVADLPLEQPMLCCRRRLIYHPGSTDAGGAATSSAGETQTAASTVTPKPIVEAPAAPSKPTKSA